MLIVGKVTLSKGLLLALCFPSGQISHRTDTNMKALFSSCLTLYLIIADLGDNFFISTEERHFRFLLHELTQALLVQARIGTHFVWSASWVSMYAEA